MIFSAEKKQDESTAPPTQERSVADLFTENGGSPITSTQRKKKSKKGVRDNEDEAPAKARKRLAEPIVSLGGQQENNCRSPVDVMTTPNVEAEKSYKVHFFFCVFLPIKCLFGTVLAVSLLGVMLN